MNPSIRPPAVAGSFYPEGAKTLSGEIAGLLALARRQARADDGFGPPKAIIAPHAGYIYSGPVAATVYAQLEARRDEIRHVVLLGPTHRVAVRGLAYPSAAAFATPLGVVALDRAGIAAIESLPQVVCSDAAHALEHSLEVQLPFLQSVLDDFDLLPLAVGDASAAEVAEVLDRVWDGPQTLIVVSSDLSHYLPYDAARVSDAETSRHIVALDARIDHRQACGATPVNGLLLAARRRGLQAHLVDLRNSGDTAGDKSRVVGYGAFVFAGERSDAR